MKTKKKEKDIQKSIYRLKNICTMSSSDLRKVVHKKDTLRTVINTLPKGQKT